MCETCKARLILSGVGISGGYLFITHTCLKCCTIYLTEKPIMAHNIPIRGAYQ